MILSYANNAGKLTGQRVLLYELMKQRRFLIPRYTSRIQVGPR